MVFPYLLLLYIDREGCSWSNACVITCDVTGIETEKVVPGLMPVLSPVM